MALMVESSQLEGNSFVLIGILSVWPSTSSLNRNDLAISAIPFKNGNDAGFRSAFPESNTAESDILTLIPSAP